MLIFHSKEKIKFIRQAFIVLLLFALNLRPMIAKENVKSEELVTELNVLFVIDNTISMSAEDYNGQTSRMTAVRNDCEYIIKNLNGARFSVIKFDNDSKIMIPYTSDGNKPIQCVNVLAGIEKLYARGSSPNVVKDDMEKQLKNASNDRKNIVFFISDGEITNEDELASFKSLSKHVDDGAVLGYGTQEGGKMLVTDYSGKTTYLEDPTKYNTSGYGNPVALSKIDENNLKKIAKDLEIDYIHMEKQSNIESKLKDIQNTAKKNTEEKNEDAYTDIYYIILVPILILVIFEIFDYKRKEIVNS